MKKLIIIIILFINGCGNAEINNNSKKVFTSPLSQMGWYSNNPVILKNQILSYFKDIEDKKLNDIKALILPHAGFMYSGKVAAHAIKQIKGKKFERVIILGPSHHVYMKNKMSVPDFTHYKTPLGEIEVDLDFVKNLKTNKYFINNNKAHVREHSVQIELPLFQVVLKKIKIVPIVVGKLDETSSIEIGKYLRSIIGDKTLIVISTDFTHYGARFQYMPFKDNVKQNLKKLDLSMYEFIEKKDLKGFINYYNETGITVCGYNPIKVLISMLNDESKIHLMKYSTSIDITNDDKSSVSYISSIVTGKWGTQIMNEKKLNESELDVNDKKNLLQLARLTLEFYLKNKKMPEIRDLNITITPNMKKIFGAFVTLHKDGNLRGCIGEIFPSRELYKAVMDHAINSGTRDYRFPNVSINELNDLHFEISALTPPIEVNSYNDIIIGKHGMVVKKHGRSAVFLPQVAPEQNWDLETTLTHLSLKAGLKADDWKNDASFLVFEAIVFSEE